MTKIKSGTDVKSSGDTTRLYSSHHQSSADPQLADGQASIKQDHIHPRGAGKREKVRSTLSRHQTRTTYSLWEQRERDKVKSTLTRQQTRSRTFCRSNENENKVRSPGTRRNHVRAAVGRTRKGQSTMARKQKKSHTFCRNRKRWDHHCPGIKKNHIQSEIGGTRKDQINIIQASHEITYFL